MSKTLHLLAHASTGYGPLGDQTGKELSIRQFYNAAGSGGWGRVFRFKDEFAAYADRMAEMQYSGVLNGHYGYNQRRRGSAFAIAAARQMGMRYDVDAQRYVDENGVHSAYDLYMEPKWAALDAGGIRPWFVDEDAAADCSSLTNAAFTIATGIWFHKGTTLSRATMYYGDTRPNRAVSFSRSGQQYYRRFCSGSWTPYVSINSLMLYDFPCYIEETEEVPVEKVYDNPPAAFAGKTVTLHRIEFRLGQNHSTYRARRTTMTDSDGRYGYDEKGNKLYHHLYSYRWEPFMDEYIADKDGESLMKAVFNENGELAGYQTAGGTMLKEAFDLCAIWDNNPVEKETGNSARTICCNNGYEGETLDAMLAGDAAHRYVCANGQRAAGEAWWDRDTAKTLGNIRGYSTVAAAQSDGTFRKTSTKTLRYKTGYRDDTDAVFQTGDTFLEATVDGIKVYRIDGKTGFCWAVRSNVPSGDILFPFCTVEVVPIYGGMTFYLDDIAHNLPVSPDRYKTASVSLGSTGTYYRYWLDKDAQGTILHEYVQAWERDNSAVLPDDDDDEGDGTDVKTLVTWWEYLPDSGTYRYLETSPIDDSTDSDKEPTEGDIPDGGVVRSRLTVINSDANLKRGDILCTRSWSEGNTSGGHLAMYI